MSKQLEPLAQLCLQVWPSVQGGRKVQGHDGRAQPANRQFTGPSRDQTARPARAYRCMQGAQDQHPKVRWSACQAMGQLCTDLGPELQEEQHAKILPALMTLMDDFQVRVVSMIERCWAALL